MEEGSVSHGGGEGVIHGGGEGVSHGGVRVSSSGAGEGWEGFGGPGCEPEGRRGARVSLRVQWPWTVWGRFGQGRGKEGGV